MQEAASRPEVKTGFHGRVPYPKTFILAVASTPLLTYVFLRRYPQPEMLPKVLHSNSKIRQVVVVDPIAPQTHQVST